MMLSGAKAMSRIRTGLVVLLWLTSCPVSNSLVIGDPKEAVEQVRHSGENSCKVSAADLCTW
jgi:hypothetical protein